MDTCSPVRIIYQLIRRLFGYVLARVRKWLGISEHDQPPHFYRLLGIEPLGSDTDVNANAADSRMTKIKVFQAGKYSDHSQRLLNEVAAAKVCLLSSENVYLFSNGTLEDARP